MKKLQKSTRVRFLTKSTSYKNFMILLAVFFSIAAGHAQTITTTGVSVTTICSATNVSLNVTYTKTGTYTGSNAFTAQLSDASGAFGSPVNIGTLSSLSNGTITATIPVGTSTGSGYKIRVVSSSPAITGSISSATLNITLPPGNPSVFGNGIWNAYVYNGNKYNTYYGLYTENNINLSSITRWDQNSTPSAADASSGNAYTGCAVPVDNHSVSYKRTNFACGEYQIDVTGNDDDAILLINGVQVWSRNTATAVTYTNAWTGFLENSSTVDFRWQEDGGQSYGRINLISSSEVPVALLSSAGANCTQFTANWTAFNNATNYFLDVATDAAFTSMIPGFNNLITGNVTSKLVTGLTAGTEYYYRVRATNISCGLTTGNSNIISRKITVSPAGPITICQGESVILTAGNASTYTWSPATDLSATNTAVVTASPTTTTTYTVAADATTCNTQSITVNVNPTFGNPSVFGNGTWNVYAYNGNNFNQYYGTYTENNMSFNSTNRWTSTTSASSADASTGLAYTGCPVPIDQHSVTYKRTNIPCGLYQIDINGHDDDASLFIDGVQVWVHNGCCDTHTDVWRGFLSPSNTLEFRWREYGGGSYGAVNLIPLSVPIAVAPTAGSNCTEMTANWNTIINASTYFLDVATDAAFTSTISGFNNLNVGNVTSYLVSGLTPGTIYYYRVRAFNSSCALTSGNSNTITNQVQVSASTVVICDGGSAVLTASNASTYSWSPPTGLSATTGPSVTASPTANTVYTVTGYNSGGCATMNTITVIADTIGNPAIFGNGFWNVYCYNATAFTNYRGKYTENSLSFNSTNRWAQGVSPSSANATGGNPYSGCPVNNDNHGVSYKRTNFTCGQYQIDVASHDDDAALFIDGVQVWVQAGVGANQLNVWRGFLTATSTVEFRWLDNTGSSYGSVNFTSVTTSPNAFTTSTATVCQGANNVTYTVPVVNGATSYTWSYSGTGATITGTTNSVTINYSTTATSGTLSVIANNSCGALTVARTMSITVNPLPGQPGVFTAGPSAVCQGQTAVAYTSSAATNTTSYAWSFPGGTGATFTGTTFTTNASFSSTATSGTVTLTAINACGSTITPRTIAVTVNTTPYISAGSNAPVCHGTTLNLTASTVTSATYAWIGPNTFTSAIQNPSLTYSTAAAGTYNVTATLGTCTSPASTVVTSSTNGLWVGGTSTDWNTTTNWCTYTVPGTTTDVIIPTATNLPVISGTANARALTINASATLTKAATGILNIYGNFNNNGTFTDNGIYTNTGSVIFRGGSAQSINGATVFNNLTINNTNGVSLNNTATVNGILTLTAGVFATNGNLNQNLYDGAIAGTGAGTTTGAIRFFKTIWGDKYHYLSSPTSGNTVADWADNVTMKFGPSYNLYTYNETVPDTNKLVGWTAVSSSSTALQSMTGYALYFPRWTYNTLLDLSGTYTHGATFSKSLTNTASTTPVNKPASDGWNLVGNPYPSTIDWKAASGWTKTNIDDAIYSWDGRTGKYVYFVAGLGTNGGTRYIGSMQGFFVKVTTPGTGTLSMTNNVRTTSTLYDVWRTTEGQYGDILRLTATSGEFSDETVIRFKEDATTAFDSNLDAYKLLNGGNSPSLFSVSDSTDYSINSLPSSLLEKTIPLTLVTGFAGTYTLTSDFSQFQGEQNIWFEDRELGTLLNLRENGEYSVSLDKGSIEGRFFLQYKNPSAETVTGNTGQTLDKTVEISSYLQTISIHYPTSTSKASIIVMDALGKKVYEQDNINVSAGKTEVTLPVATGIYIVRVNTNNTSTSQQVYLTK